MSNFEELLPNHMEIARAVAAEPNFNPDAAELLLRNVVVAANVSADRYSEFSESTKGLVNQTAEIARHLSPQQTDETLPRSDETAADYIHRTTISQPLDHLQRLLSAPGFDTSVDTVVEQARQAVIVGSLAFAALAVEGSQDPSVIHKEPYFRGNTDTASNRITSEDA